MTQKIIIANWKMNGSQKFCHEFMKQFCSEWPRASMDYEVVICPSYPYLPIVASYTTGTNLALGGQDCAEELSGAFTGDVSAQMLRDLTCKYVLIGHSERRQNHHEMSNTLTKKIYLAQQAHLYTVLCVGEGIAARNKGNHLEIVEQQILSVLSDNVNRDRLLIAYEPIWAIGSGRVATLEEIAEMHSHIKATITNHFDESVSISVLYGGSVNLKNARDIIKLKEVNGVLIGGSSLKIKDFLQIISV